MDILTLGVIGAATHAIVTSRDGDNPSVVERVEASLDEAQRAVEQLYGDLLRGAVKQRSQHRSMPACTVRYIWKWADTRNWSLAEQQSYGRYFILQSCSAQGTSTVPTALYQGSGNGVADDHPNWPDLNGGLNPILALNSLQWLKNGQQGKFETSEEGAAQALLTSQGLDPRKHWPDVIRTIKGVGFFKLSEYHWIAAMDWAMQLLSSPSGREPACEQVVVRFECTSESNKWYQQEWDRRLRLAAGEYFQWATNGANPAIITDYRGASVLVEPMHCGEDVLGRDIWSMPFVCGEERVLWRENVDALRAGPCRNLFRRLSPVFKQRKDPSQNRFILDVPDGVPRKATGLTNE